MDYKTVNVGNNMWFQGVVLCLLTQTNNHCCSFQYYYILENALHSAQSNEVMLKTSVNYKLMNYGCNLWNSSFRGAKLVYFPKYQGSFLRILVHKSIFFDFFAIIPDKFRIFALTYYNLGITFQFIYEQNHQHRSIATTINNIVVRTSS